MLSQPGCGSTARISFPVLEGSCSPYFVLACSFLLIFFFFFSSRRRHTRLTCDWSSDVCFRSTVPPISGREQTGMPGLKGRVRYGCCSDHGCALGTVPHPAPCTGSI